MHIGRKNKERIAIILIAAGVILALFFVARYVFRAPSAEPTPDELDSRSVVDTSVESSADIRLQEGSVIRIMENTLFSLSDLGAERAEMDVRRGEVVSRVQRFAPEQDFRVRTPGAVVGVRGTELALSVKSAEATVFGMSGTVEVWNPQFPDEATELGIHEKATATLGERPSGPQPMSEEEIERYRQILDSLNERQVLAGTEGISFEPDSLQLTGEARQALEDLSEQLSSIDGTIEIVGHTADIGPRESQLRLSQERAQAVLEHLVELGISADRLTATGAGGTRPLSDASDADAMRRNRRVEFIIEQ